MTIVSVTAVAWFCFAVCNCYVYSNFNSVPGDNPIVNAGVEEPRHHHTRGSHNNSAAYHRKKGHTPSANDLDAERHKLLLASLTFPQLYHCKHSGPPPKLPIAKHRASASNEDIWLYRNIFSKLPVSEVMSGFYIEMGALDGLENSNTLYFEKRLDWRGLLIEGQYENTLALRNNVPKHRPNAAAFGLSVCRLPPQTFSGHVTFTDGNGPVATTLQAAKSTFLDRWHPDLRKRASGKNITCVPLQSLLDLTGVLDVELFSLDVEGAELEVLLTINFEVTNIRVVVIEIDDHDLVKNQQIRDLMAANGFISSVEANIGGIKDGCDVKLYGVPPKGCMLNEAFINPNYSKRKLAREQQLNFQRYYVQGTGLPCPGGPVRAGV